MNSVHLMGNLTRDPELRYLDSGSALCKLGMAMNRNYRSGDEWKKDVCFVDITVWGKDAERCNERLSKGQQVLIEGRLTFSSWETAEGQKRSKVDVTAEKVHFIKVEDDGGEDGSVPF